MLSLDCFEKALRGPSVSRLFEAARRQKRVRARLRRERYERSAGVWAAYEASRDRGLAANGILTTCRNVRFLAMRPRIRARVSWPAAQWIRT